MKKIKYRATNKDTGEVIEEYAEGMKNILNIGLSTLYTAATTGRKISGKWSVDKIDESEIDNNFKFSKDSLRKWDERVEKIKSSGVDLSKIVLVKERKK